MVIGLIALVLVFQPHIVERSLAERYTVRHLDLQMPDPPKMRPQNAGVKYPGPVPDPAHAPKLEAPSAKPAVARQVAQAAPAPQTLLQPKLPPMVLKEKIPLPTVVLWKEENTPTPTIVPPQPKKIVAAVVPPAVQAPNEELTLDRVAVKPSTLTLTAQPIKASNTSPVVVQAPQPAAEPPQTTSKSNAQPTPTAIVALSDLRANGPVVLPAANQSASSGSSGVLEAGRPEDVGKADNGSSDKAGSGPNNASGSNSEAAAHGNGKEQGGKTTGEGKSGQGAGSKGEVDVGTALASASTGTGSVERILLPKDGQFGAVVVGSSLEEVYPEAGELWSGRLAYTVYLHVGLSKSWILQYALPPASEAATSGNAAHLAAPWPYTIVRPNLPLEDLNSDALMVRGIVTVAGKFETLALAFPPRFPQTEFLLASLRQWEFRPAMQGGHPTAVEVLLIIPEESE